MEEFFLGIIAIALVILTIELTIVLYYAIILLRETIVIIKKIQKLEGGLAERFNVLENEVSLLGAKFIKVIFKLINKMIKK